jgi:hypothetical protein
LNEFGRLELVDEAAPIGSSEAKSLIVSEIRRLGLLPAPAVRGPISSADEAGFSH